MYLSSPVVLRTDDFDVLQWWETHEAMYPRLAQVARDVLAVPLAQVGVERVFNCSKDVIGDRRHRLKPATLQRIMFLKDVIALEDDIAIDDGMEAEDALVDDVLDLPAPIMQPLVTLNFVSAPGPVYTPYRGDTEENTDHEEEQDDSPLIASRPKRKRRTPERYRKEKNKEPKR